MENIIEYLVPLIFILAYVVPKFKKSKQKEAQPQPSNVETKSQKDSLLNKLSKMVEEYSESDQEAIKKEKEQDEGSYDWYDDPYEDEEKEEEPEKLTIEVIKPEPKEKPELQVVQYDRTTVKDQKLAFSRSALSSYISSNVDKKDLRKAIVWSEILGPPKALQNE